MEEGRERARSGRACLAPPRAGPALSLFLATAALRGCPGHVLPVLWRAWPFSVLLRCWQHRPGPSHAPALHPGDSQSESQGSQILACQQPAGRLIPREREVLQGGRTKRGLGSVSGVLCAKRFQERPRLLGGQESCPRDPFIFRSDSSTPGMSQGVETLQPRVSPAISVSRLCGGVGWGFDVKVSLRQAGRQADRQGEAALALGLHQDSLLRLGSCPSAEAHVW